MSNYMLLFVAILYINCVIFANSQILNHNKSIGLDQNGARERAIPSPSNQVRSISSQEMVVRHLLQQHQRAVLQVANNRLGQTNLKKAVNCPIRRTRGRSRNEDFVHRSLQQPMSLITSNDDSFAFSKNASDITNSYFALDPNPPLPSIVLPSAGSDLASGEGDLFSKDDLGEDKIQTHTNNHQIVENGHNSRHYSTHPSINYNNYFNSNNHKIKQHSNSHLKPQNSFANNINLNYIHSLLSVANIGKPTNSLTSLLSVSHAKPSSHAPGVGLSAPYYSNNPSSLLSNFITAQNTIQQQLVPTSGGSDNGINSIDTSPSANQISGSSGNSTLDQNQEQYSFGPSMQACGKQQLLGYREPRIVGGNKTYEGEFPWAVSIQRHGNHHCGGVIVGKRWILTAAHCVRSQLVGNLLVRTGGHTLSRSINSLNSHLERDYFVEQIVMHNDFSRYDNLTASQMKSSANTNNADIALLKLKQEIVLNEFAWPVCFPHRDSGNFSGHDAIVIGWGKLNEKSDDFSNELQKVKLTIIDNKVCQNWFRQAGREMPIDDRIICAGFKSGGKDACHGDSGGPLLSKINGNYVVVGVVSTGIGCARPLLPGLYSRVSSYINWIERYVN